MPAGSPTVMPILGLGTRVGAVREPPTAHRHLTRRIAKRWAVREPPLRMMATRSASTLRAAIAAAGRVGTAAVIAAAGVLHAFAVRQLVAQAALQPAALPRELRRVETELLLLGHLDRHRLERAQPGRAAERAAAGAVAAEHLGLVAHADLAHLDAHAEVRREVADQLAEIDPRLGGVVEDQPRAVEHVLDLRQLHRQAALADLELRDALGLLLALRLLQPLHHVVLARAPDDHLRRIGGRLAPLGQLRRHARDRADGKAVGGIDDHLVAGDDAGQQVRQQERDGAPGRAELDADEGRQRRARGRIFGAHKFSASQSATSFELTLRSRANIARSTVSKARTVRSASYERSSVCSCGLRSALASVRSSACDCSRPMSLMSDDSASRRRERSSRAPAPPPVSTFAPSSRRRGSPDPAVAWSSRAAASRASCASSALPDSAPPTLPPAAAAAACASAGETL